MQAMPIKHNLKHSRCQPTFVFSVWCVYYKDEGFNNVVHIYCSKHGNLTAHKSIVQILI